MLAAGTPLGPYRVLAPLGAGGMGEVYRAHDARLGRDVAIKVLPQQVSATDEARARFEREARTISQLSHPHICALYDVGREGDTDYLVMELLEGETLAHRLEKGALPLGDVLRIGSEIASALDRAHAAGVVHRDLKPGNVMLTRSGAKLMDFGLARPGAAVSSPGLPGDLPTVTQPLTAQGVLVGTFQYMAPEQLEGREADARSDIFALGAVLYEMSTGRRAFSGTSQASLIAAILREEPRSIAELQPLTPPAFEHVVRVCLAKDPDERWQNAADLARQLRWVAGSGTSSAAAAKVGAPPRRRAPAWAWLPWLVTAVVVVAALIAVASGRFHRPSEIPSAMFDIDLPAGLALLEVPALSPDGRWLVFAARDSTNTTRLWLRPLGDPALRSLPGTEGDNLLMPFWSPNSRDIAFFADGKVRRVSREGGQPVVVCAVRDMRGGSWNRDDVMLIAAGALGICRVPATGGTPVTVVRADSTDSQRYLRYPTFLPDGSHFLYICMPLGGNRGDCQIRWASLDGAAPRHVIDASSSAIYAEPGQLVFRRGNALMAQSFDPRSGSTRGAPRALAPARDVWSAQKLGAPTFTTSACGLLVCEVGATGRNRLYWYDRSGRQLGAASVLLPFASWATVSPDARQALYAFYDPDDGGRRLWLVDLGNGNGSRLTQGDDGWNGATWSPDGRRVCFQRAEDGGEDLYDLSLDGSRTERRLFSSGASPYVVPGCYAPDGKSVVASVQGSSGNVELGQVSTSGSGEWRPLLSGPADFGCPTAVSPDGRWLAYVSNETGQWELYITSFPVPGIRTRVSTDGCSYDEGLSACGWTRGGRELLFVAADNRVMAADVSTGSELRVKVPRELFHPPVHTHGLSWTSDGERFLLALPGEPQPPHRFTVLVNWQDAEARQGRD